MTKILQWIRFFVVWGIILYSVYSLYYYFNPAIEQKTISEKGINKLSYSYQKTVLTEYEKNKIKAEFNNTVIYENEVMITKEGSIVRRKTT